MTDQPSLLDRQPPSSKFDGVTFEPDLDAKRLTGQLKRTYDAMIDGQWRTLAEIESVTGDPQASISARLRDLKKRKFGSFIMERRRRGDPKSGLFEYRVLRVAE